MDRFRLIPAHHISNGRTLIVFVTWGKGSETEETGRGEDGGGRKFKKSEIFLFISGRKKPDRRKGRDIQSRGEGKKKEKEKKNTHKHARLKISGGIVIPQKQSAYESIWITEQDVWKGD